MVEEEGKKVNEYATKEWMKRSRIFSLGKREFRKDLIAV